MHSLKRKCVEAITFTRASLRDDVTTNCNIPFTRLLGVVDFEITDATTVKHADTTKEVCVSAALILPFCRRSRGSITERSRGDLLESSKSEFFARLSNSAHDAATTFVLESCDSLAFRDKAGNRI